MFRKLGMIIILRKTGRPVTMHRRGHVIGIERCKFGFSGDELFHEYVECQYCLVRTPASLLPTVNLLGENMIDDLPVGA